MPASPQTIERLKHAWSTFSARISRIEKEVSALLQRMDEQERQKRLTDLKDQIKEST